MRLLIFKTVFLIFLSSFTFAQKIKIKKDQILIDKLPVAKLIKEYPFYEFRSLDGNQLFFKAEVKTLKLYDFNSYRWLEVSDKENAKKAELELPVNTKKQIVKLFVEEYKLLNSKGFVQTNMENLLAQQRPNLSKKYKDLYDQYKQDVDTALTYGKKLRVDNKSNKIYFKSDDKSEAYLGSYSQINELGSVITLIKNVNNVEVAQAKPSGTAEIDVVSKNDRVDNFSYGFLFKYNDENTPLETQFIQELVGFLYAKNIYLDNREGVALEKKASEIKSQRIKKNLDKFEIDKKNSSNIYDSKGSVKTKDGDVFEGLITLKFEAIENANDTFGNSLTDATSYGKSVLVKYVNSKGKNKLKSFSSRKLPQVKLDSDIRFAGIKIITDGLSIASNALSSLNFDNSKFYKIVFENDNYLIIQDLPSERFGIKSSDKDKGIIFTSSNADKNRAKLIKYLGNNIEQKISNLNFKSREDLITLVKSL